MKWSLPLLLSCTGTEMPESESTSDAVETGTEAGSPVEASELAEQLESALALLPSLTATPMLDAYHTAMSSGTSRCPELTVVEAGGLTTTYWWGECWADDTGDTTVFNGPMTHWSGEDVAMQTISKDPVLGPLWTLPAEGTYTLEALNGQTDIYARDGDFDFDCAGSVLRASGLLDEGSRHWSTRLSGVLAWSEAEDLVGTWMEGGTLRPELMVVVRDSATKRRFRVEGSLIDLTGATGVSMDLEVVRDTEGGCAVAEAGTAAVWREDLGHWVEAAVSVDASCALCATIDGETACADTAPLLDWEDSPW